jgi:uncharacterized protein (DUF2267 family)
VRYETFLQIVETEAGEPTREAEWAIAATLLTLGERLSAGTTHALARRLPFVLGAYLENDDDARSFDLETFLRRVSERERRPVIVPTAQRHALGVFAAIGRAAGEPELRELTSELSDDYEPLLAAARRARAADGDGSSDEALVSFDTFLDRVGRRTDLDRLGAERATDAVLEALGERVARGEIEDLERELPRELHPALERGEATTGGEARRMPAGEFLARVAALEAVGPDEATSHVEAVFAALRETVSADELADLTAELSEDYAPLFARP